MKILRNRGYYIKYGIKYESGAYNGMWKYQR